MGYKSKINCMRFFFISLNILYVCLTVSIMYIYGKDVQFKLRMLFELGLLIYNAYLMKHLDVIIGIVRPTNNNVLKALGAIAIILILTSSFTAFESFASQGIKLIIDCISNNSSDVLGLTIIAVGLSVVSIIAAFLLFVKAVAFIIYKD